MPDPAFIVEGFMEQKIVQRLCPGKKVIRLEMNGTDVSLEAIANQIETQFLSFGNRHYPIIVIFDREERNKDPETLINELLHLLNENQDMRGQMVVGMPDRMIENWILADWDTLANHYGLGERPDENYEGTHGKRKLRSLLPSDCNYHETTDGVDIFIACDPKRISEFSESFFNFERRVCQYCSWIDC